MSDVGTTLAQSIAQAAIQRIDESYTMHQSYAAGHTSTPNPLLHPSNFARTITRTLALPRTLSLTQTIGSQQSKSFCFSPIWVNWFWIRYHYNVLHVYLRWNNLDPSSIALFPFENIKLMKMDGIGFLLILMLLACGILKVSTHRLNLSSSSTGIRNRQSSFVIRNH